MWNNSASNRLFVCFFKGGQCSATKREDMAAVLKWAMGLQQRSTRTLASQITQRCLARELNTGGSKTKPACKYIIKTKPFRNTFEQCWLLTFTVCSFYNELFYSYFYSWTWGIWFCFLKSETMDHKQIFYPMSPFFDSPSLFVCKNSLTYFSCSFQSSYIYLLSPSPHYPSTSSCMLTCTDGLLASERWDLKDS